MFKLPLRYLYRFLFWPVAMLCVWWQLICSANQVFSSFSISELLSVIFVSDSLLLTPCFWPLLASFFLFEYHVSFFIMFGRAVPTSFFRCKPCRHPQVSWYCNNMYLGVSSSLGLLRFYLFLKSFYPQFNIILFFPWSQVICFLVFPSHDAHQSQPLAMWQQFLMII